jgi:hypothetical protein
MATFTLDTPDTDTPTMNGSAGNMTTETPSVSDFNSAAKERKHFFDRLPQRWRPIAGVVGGSIALATTATVVANVIARRRTDPGKVYGLRPIRRIGLRHLETPRGGTAWLAYIYRTPDLRLRLPIHT